MLPPLTTVASMEVVLGVAVGSLAGGDLDRAELSLADASAIVRSTAGGVSWVDEDGVTITAPHEVIVVTRNAALRQYRNPDGYTGESVGDYSYQFGQQAGSVGVYLNEDEKALVLAAAAATKGGSFTGSIGTPSAYTTTDPAYTDDFGELL